MFTSRSVVNSLRFLWVFVVIWYEVGIFVQSVRQCQWPDERLASTPGNTSHILLVADPQILDERSYDDRGPLLMFLTQKIVDLNLRKSWYATLRKRPDQIIFLGDMMDGGRWNSSDNEYEAYYQRFRSIFKVPSSIPTHFTPGNHDIRLHDLEEFSPNAEDRYRSHFGPLNSQLSAAGHRIICLDGPGLVKEDNIRQTNNLGFNQWNPLPRGPLDFVRSIDRSPQPIILITHIPLARSGFECGPLREKGYIRPGVGFGYQNTLGKEVTEFLLSSLRPVVIFSGDDHDYCEHSHPINRLTGQGTREVSLKSFSMAMGIKRPGFQLLSITSTTENDTPAYADVPCFLPDQIRIYLRAYIPLLCLSMLAIFLSNNFLPVKARPSSRDHQRPGSLAGLLRSQESEHLNLPLHTSDKVASGYSWTSNITLLQSRFRLDLFRADRDRGYDRVSPMKSGLLRRVIKDIIDVAIYPCIVFSVICWWYTL